jgi:hypothetical protein
MRVGRKKIFGSAMQIGEVAAASARDEDLLADLVGVFEDRDAASTLAGLDGAHQARGAAAENQCLERMDHVGLSRHHGPRSPDLLTESHVEQTQPREQVFFQQALVNVLLV